MSHVDALPSALGWLGRQGTRALAAAILIGIAAPPLAALFKPVLAETVFVLLTLSFLRVEPSATRAQLVRPGLLILATAWMIIVIPAAFGLGLRALGIESRMPGLFIALMLQAVSPP